MESHQFFVDDPEAKKVLNKADGSRGVWCFHCERFFVPSYMTEGRLKICKGCLEETRARNILIKGRGVMGSLEHTS